MENCRRNRSMESLPELPIPQLTAFITLSSIFGFSFPLFLHVLHSQLHLVLDYNEQNQFPPRFRPLAARRNPVFALNLVFKRPFIRSCARFLSHNPFSAPFATSLTISHPNFVPKPAVSAHIPLLSVLESIRNPTAATRHITHWLAPYLVFIHG